MAERAERLTPLEEGILKTMQALDNQIARATERSPSQREVHGVQKWQPIEERVERTCAFVLDLLGDDQVKLDSLLVLAQSYTKALSLLVEELGPEGLGELRARYSLSAGERISRDARRVEQVLSGGVEVC